jgi:hypothetical protein
MTTTPDTTTTPETARYRVVPEDTRTTGRRPVAERDAQPGEPVEADRGGVGTSAALAMGGLARLVRLAAGVVAAIIVAGILLVVLNANSSNDIVSAVEDAARWLVGPFDGMFTLDSSKATIAVNWGIAAVVYLIVGALIARALELLGYAGLRRRRATTR